MKKNETIFDIRTDQKKKSQIFLFFRDLFLEKVFARILCTLFYTIREKQKSLKLIFRRISKIIIRTHTYH